MTPDIIAALEAFAAYADPRRSVPASMPVTSGSSMARKQLTMGDCYAAADALAALSTSPTGQEVREASVAEEWTAYMDEAVSKAPEPLRQLGEYLAGLLDEDQWKTAERYLNAAALSSVEPAGNGREETCTERRAPLCVFSGHAQAADQEAMTPEEAWQELVEYDDRTSPEEYPDMALITIEELRAFMGAASGATHPAPALDGVRALLERCQEELRLIRLKDSSAVYDVGLRTDLHAALSSPSEGESAPASSGAGDDLRKALKEARDALLTVGNDYPGSSCQRWCTDKARDAWNALQPWKHCPSTHCERAQECRSVNECSAEGATLTTPLSHDAEGESATVSREVAEAECENCGEVYGEDPFCPVHGDRAK
ncbi:hypothetical protein [Sphingobium sp. YC-XJ3]|uniref:hypothetical protein n=1 Tax=Sphingobium sp. YC-XJ3 TaxID=3024245 RepID=UPI00235E1032|nr:hypothetical protein [Sphingobium sp. YC-XJ3]WDA37826.1 hypothetical protein PO876_06505 [Sphingobium sp. YC-XJ3]